MVILCLFCDERGPCPFHRSKERPGIEGQLLTLARKHFPPQPPTGKTPQISAHTRAGNYLQDVFVLQCEYSSFPDLNGSGVTPGVGLDWAVPCDGEEIIVWTVTAQKNTKNNAGSQPLDNHSCQIIREKAGCSPLCDHPIKMERFLTRESRCWYRIGGMETYKKAMNAVYSVAEWTQPGWFDLKS